MPGPVFRAFRVLPGILEPGSVRAGKAINQNVIPAVLVEVVSESEKVVRIGVIFAERALESRDGLFGSVLLLEFERFGGRVILMAHFEVGPLPPIRTGDDVHLAI